MKKHSIPRFMIVVQTDGRLRRIQIGDLTNGLIYRAGHFDIFDVVYRPGLPIRSCDTCVVLVDDVGLLNDSHYNARATMICGTPICGNAVIVDTYTNEDGECDCRGLSSAQASDIIMQEVDAEVIYEDWTDHIDERREDNEAHKANSEVLIDNIDWVD